MPIDAIYVASGVTIAMVIFALALAWGSRMSG